MPGPDPGEDESIQSFLGGFAARGAGGVEEVGSSAPGSLLARTVGGGSLGRGGLGLALALGLLGGEAELDERQGAPAKALPEVAAAFAQVVGAAPVLADGLAELGAGDGLAGHLGLALAVVLHLLEEVLEGLRGAGRVVQVSEGLGVAGADEVGQDAVALGQRAVKRRVLGAVAQARGLLLGGLGAGFGPAAGGVLPEAVRSALGIAIYGMFLAIIIPPAKRLAPVRRVLVLAAGLSCLIAWTPLSRVISSGFSIVLCTLAAAGAGAWLFPREEADHAG